MSFVINNFWVAADVLFWYAAPSEGQPTTMDVLKGTENPEAASPPRCTDRDELQDRTNY